MDERTNARWRDGLAQVLSLVLWTGLAALLLFGLLMLLMHWAFYGD